MPRNEKLLLLPISVFFYRMKVHEKHNIQTKSLEGSIDVMSKDNTVCI